MIWICTCLDHRLQIICLLYMPQPQVTCDMVLYRPRPQVTCDMFIVQASTTGYLWYCTGLDHMLLVIWLCTGLYHRLLVIWFLCKPRPQVTCDMFFVQA